MKIRVASFALLLAITTSTNLFSRVYHVSMKGSDEYAGTIFRPFYSIQKAIDLTEAGDTIFVEEGMYKEEIEVKNKKGTAEKPIFLKALGEVTIFGEVGREWWEGVVEIENSDHIIFSGFTVRNAEWFGIKGFHCRNIRVEYCHVMDAGASGIYIKESENVHVISNEVQRVCIYPVRFANGEHGSQECISIVSCDGFEVGHNKIHEPGGYNVTEFGGTGTGGEGIDVKEGSRNGSVHHNYIFNITRLGLYLDAWDNQLFNVAVYNNVVHQCMHGIGISAENRGHIYNIRVFNNLIYNNSYEGISLYSWGGEKSGDKDDIHIYNNTIYNNGAHGINLGDKENHSDIKVYNNISYMNGREVVNRFADYSDGRDLPTNFEKGKAQNIDAKNNLIGEDPKFRNFEFGDFSLAGDSPAIDAGTGVELDHDKDVLGSERVKGEVIDIGAFEFQGD